MPKKHKISQIPHTICHTIVSKFNDFIGYQNEGLKLHQAIQDKNYELIAEILADKKTDPNLRDADNNTPLYYAFKLENKKIIKALLNHRNIDLNSPLTLELFPVQNAALFGHHEYLKMLLDTEKVQLNITDGVGDNILAYAIYSGSIETVKLLTDNQKVNLMHRNIFGCNALHLASMNRQLEIVKLLLKKIDVQEKLEAVNNSQHHFQHILLNAFECHELTQSQLKDLKEIFSYRILLTNKEIDSISNSELKKLVHNIDQEAYLQYGKIKSAHLNIVPHSSMGLLEHSQEENLIEYGLHDNDHHPTCIDG